MTLGQRIEERRLAVGISQAELARRVGVRQSTINSLINGDSRSSRSILQIARELGTTPAFLSGETDDPEADAPPAPEYSPDERAWIDYWRALDGDGRDAMVRVVRLLTGDRAPARATAILEHSR